MTGETIGAIMGSSVATAVAMAAAGRWIVSAIVREDLKPLERAMIEFSGTAKQLADALNEQKAEARQSRTELHDAVEAIRGVLANHETRITVIEAQAPSKTRVRARRAAE